MAYRKPDSLHATAHTRFAGIQPINIKPALVEKDGGLFFYIKAVPTVQRTILKIIRILKIVQIILTIFFLFIKNMMQTRE